MLFRPEFEIPQRRDSVSWLPFGGGGDTPVELNASSASTATLVTIRSLLRSLSAESASSTTLGKLAAYLRSLSAESVSDATVETIKVILVALSATVSSSAAFVRTVGRSMVTTATSGVSLVRNVGLVKTATSAAAATVSKLAAYLRSLSTSSASAASMETIKVILLALTATVAATASFSRHIARRMAVTGVSSATYLRAITKRMNVTSAIAGVVAAVKNSLVGNPEDLVEAVRAIIASIFGSINTVAYSATPVFDLSLGRTQQITLSGNVTSSSVINQTAGRTYTFKVNQDGTGGWTFAWPAVFRGVMQIGGDANTASSQQFLSDGTYLWAKTKGNINS